MDIDLDSMRRDFGLAALANEWPEDFRSELVEEIRKAIASKDNSRLEYWAGQIKEGATRWREWCARVRDVERRIRGEILP